MWGVVGCLRNNKKKITSAYFQIVQSVNFNVGEKEAPSILVSVAETGSTLASRTTNHLSSL